MIMAARLAAGWIEPEPEPAEAGEEAGDDEPSDAAGA